MMATAYRREGAEAELWVDEARAAMRSSPGVVCRLQLLVWLLAWVSGCTQDGPSRLHLDQGAWPTFAHM